MSLDLHRSLAKSVRVYGALRACFVQRPRTRTDRRRLGRRACERATGASHAHRGGDASEGSGGDRLSYPDLDRICLCAGDGREGGWGAI
jgi:hypothetical protein